jgi:hypothetical protein
MADVSPESAGQAADSQVRRRTVFGVAGIVALTAAVGWAVFSNGPASTPDERAETPSGTNPREEDHFGLPAPLTSKFRNTTSEVAYVGNDACIDCHRDEFATYLETNHSRSFSDVNVATEPPDGEFHHDLSGRSYRVYRDGESIRLREFIRDDDGQEVVLFDEAATHGFGSGNYSRMYLIEDDGFLIESPVTWYPRLNKWGMSAGFEKDPLQHGFTREVSWGCTNCHAGRVQMVDGAANKLHVEQKSISCERCHGPGELHVREREAKLPIKGGIDDSIVNVRHLSRERQEDVCSQCHLSGAADIEVRGRSMADYRPGLRISDFRVSYRVDREATRMTVSGQIEQMRLSRCYIESETMTCATCHNPHSRPDESDRVAHFRNKCLECHSTESCGVSLDTRITQQPDDNCVTCHMPRGPTDIPHLSFTHHRIGIHAEDEATKSRVEAEDQLVAVSDISFLPEQEQQRLLGLANEMFAGRVAGGLDDDSTDDDANAALGEAFRRRATQILGDVRAQGLTDPEVETFFSTLHWRQNPSYCIAHAEAALRSSHIPPVNRASALHHLATSHFDQRNFEKALSYLEELVKVDRDEIALMLLGICYQNLGKNEEALSLFERAVQAAPQSADLRGYLGSVYQRMGRDEDAAQQTKLAELLSRKVPQPQ